jgi:hypothetical protein
MRNWTLYRGVYHAAVIMQPKVTGILDKNISVA